MIVQGASHLLFKPGLRTDFMSSMNDFLKQMNQLQGQNIVPLQNQANLANAFGVQPSVGIQGIQPQTFQQQYRQVPMTQLRNPFSAFTDDYEANPRGNLLYKVGIYEIKEYGSEIRLSKKLEKKNPNTNSDQHLICTWNYLPTRSLVAHSIREDRNRRPRINARDDFGSLIGLKYFGLVDSCHLISPSQMTVWNTSVLVADNWSDSPDIRNQAGIHAYWPTYDLSCFSGAVSVKGLAWALVRGQGRFKAGEVGWRAETVIIDAVYLTYEKLNNWRLMKVLEKHYPEVTFKEAPWTLERLSKKGR